MLFKLIVIIISVFYDLLMVFFGLMAYEINGFNLRFILIGFALVLSCVFVNQIGIDILY